jgi:D-beta-D-heptose 7-phosphate kinase/D-beta-D-heptose 1-phosphate adenosyltransferase
MVTPQDKILTRDAVLDRYGPARSERIVFTNGVFDVLHRGHVEYLFHARSLGDVLLVGLNSDASTRRLKGPTRPINPQADRAFVLAGLGCVDAISIFEEDTPLSLISALLPDVLAKGGDYRPEDVVGRGEVESAGGRLVIIPFVEGRSSTSILQRVEAGT